MLLTGVPHSFMAVIGQIIKIVSIAGHSARRGTVIPGTFAPIVVIVLLAALSNYFQMTTTHLVPTGVAFTSLFAFTYVSFFNSINWVLLAEIFYLNLSGIGAGVGVSVLTPVVRAS